MFFSFCLAIFRKFSNTWVSTSSLALLAESKFNSSMQISGYIISPWVRFSSNLFGTVDALKPSASVFNSPPEKGKKKECFYSPNTEFFNHNSSLRTFHENFASFNKMLTKLFPATLMLIKICILNNQVWWIA